MSAPRIFPLTEPATGLRLVAGRPMEWGGRAFAAGESFPWRDLGLVFEQVRAMYLSRAVLVAEVQLTAIVPQAFGERVIARGESITVDDLGPLADTEQLVLGLLASGGMQITGYARPAAPAAAAKRSSSSEPRRRAGA